MAEQREVSEALAEAAAQWVEDQEAEEETEAPVEEEALEAPSDQSDTDEGDEDGQEAAEDEVPTSYFGTDLSHITDPQARKAVIETLEEQNRTVNRRLQEIAEFRKQAQEAKQPEPPQAPSVPEEVEAPDVAEVMQNIGVDTTHPYYEELKDFLEPIAMKAWEAEQKVVETVAAQSDIEFVKAFTGELDTLESTHGELPYSREDVLAYADDTGLYNPTALYWSIMGPLKEAATQEAAKRVNQAEQQVRRTKKAVAGTKPRTSAKGTTEAPKARTLAEMLAQAEERTGQSIISE